MASHTRIKPKGQATPEPVRFTIPNMGSITAHDLIDSMGGAAQAAKVIRVTQELIDLWQSGQVETPWTAMLALWWQSPYGFAQAFNESHWTHQYNSMLKREARDRVELLEAFIHAQGMQPPGRQLTTHREMLLAGPYNYELHQLARSAGNSSDPPVATVTLSTNHPPSLR